jgi:hypothetical protein
MDGIGRVDVTKIRLGKIARKVGQCKGVDQLTLPLLH